MIAYLAIFFTAVAALAGAPIWVAVFGAAMLFTLSLVEQRRLKGRFAEIGSSYVLTLAAWQSAANALTASGAAYLLGWFCRHLFTPY